MPPASENMNDALNGGSHHHVEYELKDEVDPGAHDKEEVHAGHIAERIAKQPRMNTPVLTIGVTAAARNTAKISFLFFSSL